MSQQMVTFRIGGELYGVDVAAVQEVFHVGAVTPVPLVTDELRGLVNLRGQIVPALDVRKRLALDSSRNDEAVETSVVVRASTGTVCLFVDEIGDVVEVSEDDELPPPSTVRNEAAAFVRSVFPMETELLVVLDVERLAAASNNVGSAA